MTVNDALEVLIIFGVFYIVYARVTGQINPLDSIRSGMNTFAARDVTMFKGGKK
jgi:hypothetical protein